jgi:hypothetical protein
MKLLKSLFLSCLLLTIVFLVGCSEETTTSIEPDVTGQQLSKFSLPVGATLESAEFKIFAIDARPVNVNIYRITQDWGECSVTWGTKPTYDPTVEGTFFVDDPNNVWLSTDIKSLVQKWLDGMPNYGFYLDQVEETTTWAPVFASREQANQPSIEVVYSIGGVNQPPVIVPALADVYIWEGNVDYNGCDKDILYTGYTNETEKQSLLKFDIEYVPQVECETAFAYDGDNLSTTIGTCFSQYGFDRWGWSIYLPGTGTYTFPVYAGAGQCDITKGTYVGDVTVVYASNGTVTFTYDFEQGFSASETHFYAGKTTVARDNKGKPTVAPGQYKVTPNLTGGIYIIAHAVVCSSDWD